jgi:hypothetical protein
MCQEGIQLVRNPLPIYPHAKTIQTDEEDMEVAQLLGNGGAIILQGHGAITTGNSERTVTAFISKSMSCTRSRSASMMRSPHHSPSHTRHCAGKRRGSEARRVVDERFLCRGVYAAVGAHATGDRSNAILHQV